MSTKLWTVLAPNGPAVQDGHHIRQSLRDAGLVVADQFTCEANAAILAPAASKIAWFQAGYLLGRGGALICLGRDGRARKIESLGANTCADLNEFLTRLREGMV